MLPTFSYFCALERAPLNPRLSVDASETWIHTTSIDLNPQAPHVIKSNFFDFPIPAADEEDESFDVVSLSLVMNFEGSLINRGTALPLLSLLGPYGSTADVSSLYVHNLS